MKYVAIKVRGLKHWLWFDKDKVEELGGIFTGEGGWGDGGALTEITVSTEDIVGRIFSENLQYN